MPRVPDETQIRAFPHTHHTSLLHSHIEPPRFEVFTHPLIHPAPICSLAMSDAPLNTAMLSALHERIVAVVGDRSYRHIGELTAIHPETVRRYMAGQAPSTEFLTALCRALGVNGDWMLTGRGPMHAADVHSHALREAAPPDLLSALASAVEVLIQRVERLEVFVQTMETRLRAANSSADPSPTHSNSNPLAPDRLTLDGTPANPIAHATTPLPGPGRAKLTLVPDPVARRLGAIVEALPERTPPPHGGTPPRRGGGGGERR